jgi:hypothetical protein
VNGGKHRRDPKEDAMLSTLGTWPWTGNEDGTFALAADATLRVRPGRHGVTLRAERGTVHVTQAGDREDHVLLPGQAVWLPRGGLVVACAFEPARLVVEAARAERPRGMAVRAAAA